jgi:hypothetical protein
MQLSFFFVGDDIKKKESSQAIDIKRVWYELKILPISPKTKLTFISSWLSHQAQWMQGLFPNILSCHGHDE